MKKASSSKQKIANENLPSVNAIEKGSDFLAEIMVRQIDELKSRGSRPENIKEFAELGQINKLKVNKEKEKERLACQNCGKVFLVEVYGNTALFNAENSSGLIVVKFKEMIGICTSCLEKEEDPNKACTWLPSKEKLWRYLKNADELLPYVELLNYPPEYTVEYARNNPKPKIERTLEGRYKNALSAATKAGVRSPQALLKWIRKSLLSPSVEK